MNTKIIVYTLLILVKGFVVGRAQPRLSREKAEVLTAEYLSKEKTKYRNQAHKQWTDRMIIHDIDTMRILYKVFGDEPEDGRSLYISMHGGGQGPEEMNDGQWRNQIRLYEPREGVYVAPRAPTNTWNMWHRGHIDTLFAELIKTTMLTENVNPNKVYIMGYSAGGDGVYQLAPRLADHWAAAAMMAGHPNEAVVAIGNLRNLPFILFMGELDRAYDRNKIAIRYSQMLDSLALQEPGYFVHDSHVFKGMGHWMDRADTIAIPWLASYIRNPYPNKVIWMQDDVLSTNFYWLTVAKQDCRAGKQLVVSRSGNRFDVEKCDYPYFGLMLNDRFVNIDKPIEVYYNGKCMLKRKVRREETIISETAKSLDVNFVFYAKVIIDLKN